jgi:hypothetical protein
MVLTSKNGIPGETMVLTLGSVGLRYPRLKSGFPLVSAISRINPAKFLMVLTSKKGMPNEPMVLTLGSVGSRLLV